MQQPDSKITEIGVESYKEVFDEKCLTYVYNHFIDLTKYITHYNEENEWDDYFKDLQTVFSEKSYQFAELTNLHENIFSIFNLISNESTGLSEDMQEKINEEIKEFVVDDFLQWIKRGEYQAQTNICEEVEYALREVAPDYYLLQLLKEDMRTKVYYKLIFQYKDLFNSSNDSMKQLYRMGIITDYLFHEITDKMNGENDKEVLEELKAKLAEKTELLEAKREDVVVCFYKYYKVLKQYRKLIFQYLDDMQFSKIKDLDFENILKQTKALFEENETNAFRTSVTYVENLQIQKGWKDVFAAIRIDQNLDEEIRLSFDTKSVKIDEKKKNSLYAWNVSSLIECLNRAAGMISDPFEQVWFRGHKSCKHKLLPSLFRIKNGKDTFYEKTEPRKVMEALFDSFQVRTFGSMELYGGGDESRIGILSAMQHYSVPTNILDWSLSAFTAIYFAVEDIILSEGKRSDKKASDIDAEIWLLNPVRLKRTSRDIDEDEEILSDYPIPAIFDGREDYKEYIPYSEESKPYNLPVAVYVPYNNPRIKAQMGTFTMFSLEEKGKPTKDGKSVRFKDLETLQEEYKEKCTDEKYKPFLASVRISKRCLPEIAAWISKMGVSKMSIYPELENTSRHLTKEIKEYWEKKEEKS